MWTINFSAVLHCEDLEFIYIMKYVIGFAMFVLLSESKGIENTA